MGQVMWLALLGAVAFGQNMAFTWSSRSRNSGDPKYHAVAATFSNGIWLLCNLLIWKHIWAAFEHGDWTQLIPMFAVYVLATSSGSVFMMSILVKRESGKRRVGAH